MNGRNILSLEQDRALIQTEHSAPDCSTDEKSFRFRSLNRSLLSGELAFNA